MVGLGSALVVLFFPALAMLTVSVTSFAHLSADHV